MRRAIAGVYFVALSSHCLLWLRGLLWPAGTAGDTQELLGLVVLATTPLVLLGALLGLVEPRKPVAAVVALVILVLLLELWRAGDRAPTPSLLEGAVAATSLLLGVVGLVVVGRGR